MTGDLGSLSVIATIPPGAVTLNNSLQMSTVGFYQIKRFKQQQTKIHENRVIIFVNIQKKKNRKNIYINLFIKHLPLVTHET